MALPADFQTVTVYGKWVGLDGQPSPGKVTMTPTAERLVSAGTETVIIGTPQVFPLDSGEMQATVAATDDPDIAGSPFSYTVQVQASRHIYEFTLTAPVGSDPIDLSEYTPPGDPVPDDPESVVYSLSGQSGHLSLADVGAVDTSVVGQPDGVASLDATGQVPDAQLPPDAVTSVNSQTGDVVLAAADVSALPDTYTAPVQSVNGTTGAVSLDAADVSAVPSADVGQPSGVASLDSSGIVPDSQLPASSGAALRIADLTWPQMIAHRGAAAVAPENTLEAIAAAIDGGCQLVELDVWLGPDESLPLLHDTDLSRTHGVSIDASAMTSAATNLYPVDGPLLGFAGWPNLKMPTLLDVFSNFAGTPVCWLLEVKATGLTTSELTAAGDAVVALVQRYGLEESVIVQSFDQDAVVTALKAGIPGGFLDTDGSTSPSTIAANGFSYYGVRQDASSTVMADIKSQGMRLMVWTCNRHVERDAMLAENADGIVTDQPWYLRSDRTPATRAALETATWAPGHLISPVTEEPGTFNSGGYEIDRSGTVVPNYSADTLGQISPVADPTSFTLTLNMQILAADSTNDSGQVQICVDDTGYDDNDHARVNSYNVLIRQNGTVDIYRADGSATLLNSSSGDAVQTTTVLTITVAVTSTDITVTRSGEGADVVSSTTDTSFRGGYIGIGSRDTHTRFSNVTVS